MKVNIELNITADGRTFLNFWDAMHGNDVVAELREGQLFVDFYSEEEDGTVTENEGVVDMLGYAEMVKHSISKWK